MGTSLTRRRTPVGPYSTVTPETLQWSWAGGAARYERRAHVRDLGTTRGRMNECKHSAVCRISLRLGTRTIPQNQLRLWWEYLREMKDLKDLLSEIRVL